MRRHSKTPPMSGDLMVDVEGRELDASANSTARMLSVQADDPVALPRGDEIFDPETGEIMDEEPARDARGMTEAMRKRPARWTLARMVATAPSPETALPAEGPAEEQPGDPEQPDDDKPAWHAIVEEIRSGIAPRRTPKYLKAVDDKFVNTRAGLPDEIVAELEAASPSSAAS